MKQSNNYPTILGLILLAIALVGGAGLFLAHLILAGDWSDFFSEPGLAAITLGILFSVYVVGFIVFLSFYYYGFFWRDRWLRAAAQGEGPALVAVPDQPDQCLALRVGETLTRAFPAKVWLVARQHRLTNLA